MGYPNPVLGASFWTVRLFPTADLRASSNLHFLNSGTCERPWSFQSWLTCRMHIDSCSYLELQSSTYAHSIYGIDVWFHKDDPLPGERWMETLESAIRSASAMIVYIGRVISAKPVFGQRVVLATIPRYSPKDKDEVFAPPST